VLKLDDAPPVPFPVSVTVWGEVAEVSVIVRLALLVPASDGLKVTEIVQETFIARVEPQVVALAKSEVFVPAI